MVNEKLIFVTNDDSYASKGFKAAIEVARQFGKVIAIAPDTVQSGKSQAITICDMLRLREISKTEDVEVYSINGTPVDCVKFALDYFLKDRKIDLMISGVNHGSNAAANVLYSGTMGAAIEAAFYNIPSIGLSNLDHSDDADFEASVEYGTRIARTVLESNLPLPLCLNVNIPILPVDQIKGIKVCRQTRGYWKDEFHKRTDPYGRDYYWLTGGFDNHEPEATDTDEWALKEGYVSIVPIQVDLTAYDRLEQLGGVLQQ
jgi:5'-nucleotidase